MYVLCFETLVFQIKIKRIPIGRVAHAETPDGGQTDSPVFEIFSCGKSFFRHKRGMVKTRGFAADVVMNLSFLFFALISSVVSAASVGHFQSRAFCQRFHRLNKRTGFIFHDKSDGVSADAADKAMKILSLAID